MAQDNAHARVIARLEAAARAGHPGDRLPSVRALTDELRVGPQTVQRAVAELAARGALEARPGRGTFVAGAPEPVASTDTDWQTVALDQPGIDASALGEILRPPPPGAYVLSTGYLPADLQPIGALGAALARAARRPAAWDRVPVEGIRPLREHFARAIGVQPHEVLVTGGGQAAIAACLRAFVPPGGAVAVDSPTYLGVLAAARAQGLRIVPVPTDEDGVRPDLLAAALERSGARIYYAQPLFSNPTGATLATERRAAVLAAVAAHGAFLVEDDTFRDLALDGAEPPVPLVREDPHGHVVHIRSLTKSAAPGLRIAAVAVRGPAAARLTAARLVEDYFVPGPLQEAAVDLVSAPGWPRHLRRVRSALRERRDRLLAEVAAHLGSRPRTPAGGMHLWAPLEPGEDDVALAARAAAAGVVVAAGRPWFPAEPPAPFLRLTYAGDAPERLAEGVRRLARARG